ncbi:shikimate kinase [Luteimonas aestuarii]|uniref:Shikimate kinase n=1 Tax=Luteimonas aestuarii TaxID=453837 RepID=A0A4V3AML9_9GAMM|nr:shikimate kinase [Luteimonas aestuarii]TDK27383.1 shikimate kinase [Luteimonas aestuarii]
MKTAPNLVLVGPMGAGKSSIGRRIAGRFGLAFIDADREIEKRTGANVTTIFECEGETGFRARERDTLADLLGGEAQVIATGGGAVLDAGNRTRMRERGFVVHLHVGVPRQLSRLARDRTRPLLATQDRERVLRQLAEARAPLYAEVADLRLDTDALSPGDACATLGRLLAQQWSRASAGTPRAQA